MSTGQEKVIFGASENFTTSPKIGILLGGDGGSSKTVVHLDLNLFEK